MIESLESKGFLYDEKQTAQFRELSSIGGFKKSLMIFRKSSSYREINPGQ